MAGKKRSKKVHQQLIFLPPSLARGRQRMSKISCRKLLMAFGAKSVRKKNSFIFPLSLTVKNAKIESFSPFFISIRLKSRSEIIEQLFFSLFSNSCIYLSLSLLPQYTIFFSPFVIRTISLFVKRVWIASNSAFIHDVKVGEGKNEMIRVWWRMEKRRFFKWKVSKKWLMQT